MKLFYGALVISGSFISILYAKPFRNSPPRWELPCGPSSGSSSDVPVLEIPLERVLPAMELQTKDTSIGSQGIKNIYRDRIENIDALNILDDQPPIEGIQMGYVHGNFSSTLLVNIVEALQEDYHQLSLLAVYWEAMIDDQIQYEFDMHTEDMRNTENDIYSTLCTLHMGIHHTLDSNIETFVDRSAMPSYIRNLGSDTSLRQNRNYVITRDVTAILYYLSERYNYLYLQLTGLMLPGTE